MCQSKYTANAANSIAMNASVHVAARPDGNRQETTGTQSLKTALLPKGSMLISRN
jgi:hypothetical protein